MVLSSERTRNSAVFTPAFKFRSELVFPAAMLVKFPPFRRVEAIELAEARVGKKETEATEFGTVSE